MHSRGVEELLGKGQALLGIGRGQATGHTTGVIFEVVNFLVFLVLRGHLHPIPREPLHLLCQELSFKVRWCPTLL